MKRGIHSIIVSLGIGFSAAICLAQAVYQPDLANIPKPDVEEELAAFQIPDGFEINLFAAEPDIAKPIQMSFDAEGRLWVVGSSTYPHVIPGKGANDKVVVLEDRDGDGVSDQSTVFVEGLLIPTGIAPGDGGVYVSNSTELLHLRDTNGDGKADERRIVLSGFGTEDTHHLLHTLKWGMDGSLYMNQSIYIHSHIETPYGVRRLNGGGTWKFRPETMELEVFMKGLVNHWGHIFDEWGQSFMTDGAGGEGINYVFPGATFITSPGARKILQGLNPGSPKHCGLEILTGGQFPEEWQGSLVTNDFRARRVCRFVSSDDGAGFSSKQMPELVKTSHVAFRPVDVEMGPDGALYIADFYNPIIQHGEVDFRDPRRDHEHGRIWRIVQKGNPRQPRPEIRGAPIEHLLELLRAKEEWTRLHAKLEMRERDPEKVLPVLKQWLSGLNAKDPRFDHLRLEGLWTYQNIRRTDPQLLESLLESNDPRARAAAVRVIPSWKNDLANPIALLKARIQDPIPRVRLEAVRALARFPSMESADLAMEVLDQKMDRFLDHALWLTMEELTGEWLPRVQAGEEVFGGDPKKILFALEVVDKPVIVDPLLDLLSRDVLDGTLRKRALRLVAKQGSAEQMRVLLDRVLNPAVASSEQGELLGTLVFVGKTRGIRLAGDLTPILDLVQSEDPNLRNLGIRAVGAWKVESAADTLIEIAKTRGGWSTIQALANLGGPRVKEALIDLADASERPNTRLQAIVALSSIDLDTGATRAVDVLSALPEGLDPSPLFRAFLQKKQGPQKLARALSNQQIPSDIAKLGVRLIGGTGRSEPELVSALSKAGGLASGRTEITPEEMKEILERVRSSGDAIRGEALYRSKNLNCASCHSIAGSGGKVGPDLSTIGASAQDDYLVESLLLPGAKVKEGYHSKTIYTDDGEVFTGIPIRDTEEELAIRDQFDQEISIPKVSIESIEEGLSLMPSGLTDLLTESELADLICFLSSLGEEGANAIGTRPFVRTWEVLMDTKQTKEELRVGGMQPVVVNPDFTWTRAYSRVSGVLPLKDLPFFHLYGSYSGSGKTTFLRFTLETTQPGKIGLRFKGTPPTALWQGTEAVKIDSPTTVLELEEGNETLTLALPREKGGGSISCEIVATGDEQAVTRPRL